MNLLSSREDRDLLHPRREYLPERITGGTAVKFGFEIVASVDYALGSDGEVSESVEVLLCAGVGHTSNTSPASRHRQRARP